MKLDFEEQIGRIYGAKPSTVPSYQRINENEINFTTHYNNGLHAIKREVTFEQRIKEQFDLDILAILGNRVDDGVYWFDVVLVLKECFYSLQTIICRYLEDHHAFRLYFATGMLSSYPE